MKKDYKLKGVLLKEADTPNLNGVIYSKEVLESIHNQIQKNKGTILGELGQTNENPYVNVKNAVLKVDNSTYKDGKLYIDASLLKDDLPLEFLQPALRTMATVEDNIVQGDVKVMSIDLVKKEDLK